MHADRPAGGQTPQGRLSCHRALSRQSLTAAALGGYHVQPASVTPRLGYAAVSNLRYWISLQVSAWGSLLQPARCASRDGSVSARLTRSDRYQRRRKGLILRGTLSLRSFLTERTVCLPNILQTVRRTLIRFLTEILVRRAWFGQFDGLYFVLNWLIMRCKLRLELAAEAQQIA